MKKSWQPYAQHILAAITKIQHIQKRENIIEDDI